MIFLIEYDRPSGCLFTFEKFADSHRKEASKARLAKEIELHRQNVRHEVVTLEAESEAILRQTHRRYFDDLSTLLKSAVEALRAESVPS